MPSLRFLCLHGTGTSAKIFESQLEPLSKELARDNSASFCFIDGGADSKPGPGIRGVYDGPFYSFYNWPRSFDIEDTISLEEAYKDIYATIEEMGPFDGIMGFSQGATLAFQFLDQHSKRFPFELPTTLFRCAVFICGMPPFRIDSERTLVDEDLTNITIPSVRIVGKQDEICSHSLALYELCDKDSAILLYHNKGHTIPRDKDNIVQIARAVRTLNHRAMFG